MATSYTTPLPTGVTAAELDEFFVALRTKAADAYRAVLNSGTPAEWQPYLTEYVAGLTPEPPPAGSAIIRNGDSVRVTLAIGGDAPGSPGGAAVTGNTLNFVQLT